MAMVAIVAIGAVVGFVQSTQQARAQAENARIQQLYADRAAEQRRIELDFQAAQAKNRKLALEQDAAQRAQIVKKEKVDIAERARLAKGAANAAIANNGLLVEDYGLYDDDEATSALLLADIEVGGLRAIDDAQYAADLDVRRITLAANEEQANIDQLTYSSMAVQPNVIAPGPDVGTVAVASLVNGATSTVAAGYKSGFLTKNTFSGGSFGSTPAPAPTFMTGGAFANG